MDGWRLGLVEDGWMDGWINGWMEGWADGLMIDGGRVVVALGRGNCRGVAREGVAHHNKTVVD